MTLTVPDVLLAFVLLTCVPLQYFIVQNWNSESSRAYALNKFLNQVSKFRDEYLVFSSWKKWLIQKLGRGAFSSVVSSDEEFDDYGESPAIEVMKHKEKNEYFAMSPVPRSNRSPDIKFRIGQVVFHKNWKYKGVVIGWDEKAKAPVEWLDELHGKENMRWRYMPNYSILVSIKDRLTPQITYVPEENIELIQNTKIIHPLLDDHFENFDGVQYIPRPWLRTLYPRG